MTDRLTPRGPGRAVMGLLAGTAGILMALTTGSAQAATVTVAAMNYEFQPASRTVVVGDIVRWTFSGDPHSVTSRDGLFDSGVVDPGGSFQFTFATAGTYRYFCEVHPEQMTGTIVVRTASATPRPTIRPTARPTPKPTPRPTAKPASTATPPPSAAPTTPAPTTAPTTVVNPSPSPTPSPSVVQVESSGPPSVRPSVEPDAPSPTSATDAAPIALVMIVLAAIVIGGLLVARRRRAV